MASLLEQVKGAVQGATGKLAKGSKLPSGHPLKEDNPEQATVSLDKLSGKSECYHIMIAYTLLTFLYYQLCSPGGGSTWSFYPSLFIACSRLCQ